MRVLRAKAKEAGDGSQVLGAPGVGFWKPAVRVGHLVSQGTPLGTLVELGVVVRVDSPVSGRVETVAGSLSVGYGDELCTVGALSVDAARPTAASEGGAITGSVMKSPSSGRYYGRPAPDKPPFVSPGQEISVGQVVCLLEVMKTFNRIEYSAEGLPERVRVVRVVPADGDDLDAGDPILVVEAV